MKLQENKDPNAVALGGKGGKARAKRLTPERRSEIARQAALKRWGSREAQIVTPPKCDECGTELRPFKGSNGETGLFCEDCGWSWDD
jgi:predicted Zn-ribbon and HTH transcriptional regulator